MARLSSLNIGNSAFVKPEVVASWEHFTMIAAHERPSNLEPGKIEVAFTLLFDGVLHTMTMNTNPVRHQYVEYFARGGEAITNLQLVKSKTVKMGNRAWLFEDNGGKDDNLPESTNELEYVEDDDFDPNLSSDVPF